MHVDFHFSTRPPSSSGRPSGTRSRWIRAVRPAEDRQLLREVLYELNWGDLMDALRVAAARLPDPVLDEDDEVSEERSDDTSKIDGGGE